MDRKSLLASCGPEGDAREFATIAAELEQQSLPELAATAYDRAFGINPADREVAAARNRLLDRLAVREQDLVFRYVPAGSYLMGSTDGDPDEQPVHPVELSAFWISETPLSWATYCRLMNWEPPPVGMPAEALSPPKSKEFRRDLFTIYNANKIRLQYCEDQTTQARGWHAHEPGQIWTDAKGKNPRTSRDMFGTVAREDDTLPWTYNEKPVVAVPWAEVDQLCKRLSNEQVTYRLPTEAEWEKAARGGLIGAIYAWGNEPPDATRCDFNRFDRLSIQPSRRFPPNSYGLYAMNGGIWEWVLDWYDARYYGSGPKRNPTGPATGEQKVIRGGSWADCASAMRVSFRASRRTDWFTSPNVGVRLCSVANESQA